MMTPEQFVAAWAGTQLKESAAYATHFDDLCELVSHPKPAHMDRLGERFTYQKGVIKSPHPCPCPEGRGAGVRGPGTKIKPPLPSAFLARCRELRREATDSEKLLWQLLRGRQMGGAKFRRQHPVSPFIMDFYCHSARLAIELDGGVHAEAGQARRDAERTTALEAEGVTVLRFQNNQVLRDTEGVLQRIWEVVQSRP